MQREQVKEHFRLQASEYDEFMSRIVPDYDFQTRLLIELIPFDVDTSIRVLDLGSGPGTLSEPILAAHPRSEVIAFDLTEEMLDAARMRCHRFRSRFTAIAGVYAVDDFGSGYDLILAGLTLHHLDHEQRQTAFKRIYFALNDGEAFLAREVVADDDPFIAEWHYRTWRKSMAGNGDDGEYWYRNHLAKDHPASVREAGGLAEEGGVLTRRLSLAAQEFLPSSALTNHPASRANKSISSFSAGFAWNRHPIAPQP